MSTSALRHTALGSRLAWSLVAAASTLGLAACESGSLAPASAPPGARTVARVGARSKAGWLSPEAKRGKHLVYVSACTPGSTSSVVFVFSQYDLKKGPIGEITDGVDGATGLAVDRRGNLYVANAIYPSGSTVTKYDRGSTTPSLTYTNGLSDPIGIVVDKSGRLYVANQDAWDVTEYPKGSTNPDVTISFAKLEGNGPYGLALDSAGDLFVSALGYPTARVYEVKAGSQTPKDLGIGDILVMRGIAVDKKGDVIVVDEGGRAIYVFPPGSTSPSKMITDIDQPILMSLDEHERRLYVANAGYGEAGYEGALVVYSHPKGRLLNTVQLPGYDSPTGVAVSPL